ncbi:hypothetical protein HPP92_008177 [Vanilla planifolia]|uniref:Uncharacterized protein n=1 Tax=Vanilla planifolia TaxID=51239 RepID=A0A835RBM1_VANPL|nr:hypothetical protein HPP92_008177 [Vanilla planifolia]
MWRLLRNRLTTKVMLSVHNSLNEECKKEFIVHPTVHSCIYFMNAFRILLLEVRFVVLFWLAATFILVYRCHGSSRRWLFFSRHGDAAPAQSSNQPS